jgi:hypothetical protein
MVKLRDDARQDLALLESLAVPGAHGPVRLGAVATLELAGGPAVISANPGKTLAFTTRSGRATCNERKLDRPGATTCWSSSRNCSKASRTCSTKAGSRPSTAFSFR